MPISLFRPLGQGRLGVICPYAGGSMQRLILWSAAPLAPVDSAAHAPPGVDKGATSAKAIITEQPERERARLDMSFSP